MPVDYVAIVKSVVGLVTTSAAQAIRTAPDRRLAREAEAQREALAAAPATTAEPDHCPVCTVDNEIAMGRGHVEGILAVADHRDGEIPSVIRPTVLLARQNLHAAREELFVVMSKAPSLQPQCDALGQCIDRALIDLPEPQALTVDGAARARDALVEAHVQATELAVAYYELEKRVRGNDELRTLYTEAVQSGWSADEFYERLKERL